ncbi:MAG: ABC transporter permease [Gammaproteobacteria bacterium]|jgi:putative ABC transport system permease protein|nr:ABC transporter permease [Gammaproteobacteria bacterium]MDP6166856.1 ABC transporter permease [Gammaproteobacteria bacterium]
MLIGLAYRSLLARKLTVALTVLAIAMSVALFLGVEKVRTGTQASFMDTIAGTDLIVGARTGSVQLLLYSVFHIGNATNNIGWDSLQEVSKLPGVDWTVPISLGDSHRQFRVMGTTAEFFERYQFRRGQQLNFAQGNAFNDLFDTVIGADVAKQLGYHLGDPIVVAHGLMSFSKHDEHPFRVTGILAKTGTPVDRTVMVSLQAIEAIHVDWQQGTKKSGQSTPAQVLRDMPLQPKTVTAALVGTTSPIKIFSLQRAINNYPNEPLQAVMPGVALQELWHLVGVAETALLVISTMVIVTALLGMMANVFAGLNERRREMAIYRAMGAGPRTIFLLLMTETLLVVGSGCLLGVLMVYVFLGLGQGYIDQQFGIWLELGLPSARELQAIVAIMVAGVCVSVLPALRAYRFSLADGMMVKS